MTAADAQMSAARRIAAVSKRRSRRSVAMPASVNVPTAAAVATEFDQQHLGHISISSRAPGGAFVLKTYGTGAAPTVLCGTTLSDLGPPHDCHGRPSASHPCFGKRRRARMRQRSSPLHEVTAHGLMDGEPKARHDKNGWVQPAFGVAVGAVNGSVVDVVVAAAAAFFSRRRLAASSPELSRIG